MNKCYKDTLTKIMFSRVGGCQVDYRNQILRENYKILTEELTRQTVEPGIAKAETAFLGGSDARAVIVTSECVRARVQLGGLLN